MHIDDPGCSCGLPLPLLILPILGDYLLCIQSGPFKQHSLSQVAQSVSLACLLFPTSDGHKHEGKNMTVGVQAPRLVGPPLSSCQESRSTELNACSLAVCMFLFLMHSSCFLSWRRLSCDLSSLLSRNSSFLCLFLCLVCGHGNHCWPKGAGTLLVDIVALVSYWHSFAHAQGDTLSNYLSALWGVELCFEDFGLVQLHVCCAHIVCLNLLLGSLSFSFAEFFFGSLMFK